MTNFAAFRLYRVHLSDLSTYLSDFFAASRRRFEVSLTVFFSLQLQHCTPIANIAVVKDLIR